MIKVFKRLYINPLMIAAAVLCYINRRLEIFCVSYAVMLMHELGHLCAALFLGLKPAYITLQPFGVNLKLMNKIIGSFSDEVILYLCGPAVNVVLALAAAAAGAYCRSEYLSYFSKLNLALAAVNLLPVLPLDGGIILRTLIASKFGYKKAVRTLKILSAFIGGLLFALGIMINMKNFGNFSILFMSIFILGSIVTQKEKYNHDYIKELMSYKTKPKKNAVLRVCENGEPVHSLAGDFTADKYTITAMLDSDGRIKELVTETQILDALTNAEDKKSLFSGRVKNKLT